MQWTPLATNHDRDRLSEYYSAIHRACTGVAPTRFPVSTTLNCLSERCRSAVCVASLVATWPGRGSARTMLYSTAATVAHCFNTIPMFTAAQTIAHAVFTAARPRCMSRRTPN